MSSANNISQIIRLIEQQAREFNIPWVTEVSQKKDPYKVLISCILSLRTKDKITSQAARRLFKIADSPREMIKLTSSRLEKLIYPVGFYRRKSRDIIEISRKIIKDYQGRVPSNLEELLMFNPDFALAKSARRVEAV